MPYLSASAVVISLRRGAISSVCTLPLPLPLLVWRVCDQAIGRYIGPWMPWMVPKSGHVRIATIENLHIAHAEIFTDSKNAILFDLPRKNRFRTVASTGACGRLAVLNRRSSSIHSSSYLLELPFTLSGATGDELSETWQNWQRLCARLRPFRIDLKVKFYRSV